MTPDPSAVIEALEWVEAQQDDVSDEYAPVLDLAAAARSWVEGQRIGWCVTHLSSSMEGYAHCANGFAVSIPCLIVSARICIDEGSLT